MKSLLSAQPEYSYNQFPGTYFVGSLRIGCKQETHPVKLQPNNLIMIIPFAHPRMLRFSYSNKIILQNQ